MTGEGSGEILDKFAPWEELVHGDDASFDKNLGLGSPFSEGVG